MTRDERDDPEEQYRRERANELLADIERSPLSGGSWDVQAVTNVVVKLLRESGNQALGDRYEKAVNAETTAAVALEAIRDEIGDAVGGISDLEVVARNEARARWDDAVEDFERVAADVKAWFGAEGTNRG